MVRRSRHVESDEEAKAEFDDGKSTKSSRGPSRKMFLTWMAYLCGACGDFALWHAKGSNPIKYGKFAISHLLAVSAGAGATYSVIFLVIPATYEHCVDPEQEEDFELYRGWFNDHHQAEFLNGTPPTLPSPRNGQSTATRMKRSAVNMTTPTMSSGPSETTSSVTLHPFSYSTATPVRQSDESKFPGEPKLGESITGSYSPYDARHLRGTIATGLLVLYSNLAQIALVSLICVTIYEYGLKKSARARELALENSRSTGMSTGHGHWEDSVDGSDGADAGIYMECRTTPTFLQEAPTPPMRNTTV